MFATKIATLKETQREKHVFNPGEDQHPMSWNDIHALIKDENLDCLQALQALFRARIIK